MHWPLPHTLALTFHGNAILAGAIRNGSVFHGPAWLSQRLNAARFARQQQAPGVTIMGAADWIGDLSERGARRIWLRHLEGKATSFPEAFAGELRRKNQVRVALQIEMESSTELWLVRDDRLRLVELAAQLPEPLDQERQSMEVARRAVEDGLSRLAEYARSRDFTDWHRFFAETLDLARDGHGSIDWSEDFPRELFPDRPLDGPAAHLLSVVNRAWVFWGSPDWTRVAQGEPVGDDLSRHLCAALSRAIEAAADSSCA